MGGLVGVLKFRAQFAKVLLKALGALGGVLRHDIESTSLDVFGLLSGSVGRGEQDGLAAATLAKHCNVLFSRSALFHVGSLAGGHVAAAGTSAHLIGPLFSVKTDNGLHQQRSYLLHVLVYRVWLATEPTLTPRCPSH